MQQEFKGKQLILAIKLYLSNFNDEEKAQTLSFFERYFTNTRGNIYVRKLLKYLIDNKALILSSSKNDYGYNKYYINKKVLLNILDNQEIIKLCYELYEYQIP